MVGRKRAATESGPEPTRVPGRFPLRPFLFIYEGTFNGTSG